MNNANRQQLRDIALFRRWVKEVPPQGLVFFGGAGVSTESGIPDFRGTNGMFSSHAPSQKYSYPPEVMLSHSFFIDHPREFYDYYCTHLIFDQAQPNQAHRKLAALEQEGTLRAIITQNIDGLHQAAGNKQVFELHGSVQRNYCMNCHTFYPLEILLEQRSQSKEGIPYCPLCGGIIKPDVVLYEEPLDETVVQKSIQALSQARLLVIAGTSLLVVPAAHFINYFQGDHLVIINRDHTPKDHDADLCIATDVGTVFNF